MDLPDDINITVHEPEAPGECHLVDVQGYAGTAATIGTGQDAIVALETALVNLEQLRAYIVIKLLEARISDAVRLSTDALPASRLASAKPPREYPGDATDRTE